MSKNISAYSYVYVGYCPPSDVNENYRWNMLTTDNTLITHNISLIWKIVTKSNIAVTCPFGGEMPHGV